MLRALTLMMLVFWAGPARGHLTQYFEFHDVDKAGGTVAKLIDGADDRVVRLCGMLDICDTVGGRIDVYVADDPIAFSSHFPSGHPMAERAVGVAFPREGRIVLRTHGSAHFTLSETFDHEISHVLIHRAAGQRHLPRWFLEGIAIWQAGEPVLKEMERANGAALQDDLFTFKQLDRTFPDSGQAVDLAYAQSALFVRWLYVRHGVRAFRILLSSVAAGQDFEAAFMDAFGTTLAHHSAKWASELSEQGSVMMFLRDGNFLWILMAMLIVWAYLIKRKERKAAIAAMDDPAVEARAWPAAETLLPDDKPTIH